MKCLWPLVMILMVLVHGIIVELCGILWNYFFPGSIFYPDIPDQIQDPAHVQHAAEEFIYYSSIRNGKSTTTWHLCSVIDSLTFDNSIH